LCVNQHQIVVYEIGLIDKYILKYFSEDACTLPDPVLEHFRSPLVDDFPKDIFSISPADIFPKVRLVREWKQRHTSLQLRAKLNG
jgi:hypothetical protein